MKRQNASSYLRFPFLDLCFSQIASKYGPSLMKTAAGPALIELDNRFWSHSNGKIPQNLKLFVVWPICDARSMKLRCDSNFRTPCKILSAKIRQGSEIIIFSQNLLNCHQVLLLNTNPNTNVVFAL